MRGISKLSTNDKRHLRSFASKNKKLFTAITISLFSIGTVSGALFAYQQYLKSQIPVKLSREQAISITIAEAVHSGKGYDNSLDLLSYYQTQAHLSRDGKVSSGLS